MSVGARMYTFWLGIYAGVVLQGHKVMPMLRFSRYCQTASQSSYALLHCQHQCMRAPVLHPRQHLVKFLSLFWPSLVSAWGYLIVVLTGIALMTNEVEHLFLCLLAIWMSSSVHSNFVQLKNEFSFFLLIYRNSFSISVTTTHGLTKSPSCLTYVQNNL